MNNMYKLFNKKTKRFVQDLKPNFTNNCNINSCGYHLEDKTFPTKTLAEMDAKRRISYKDLIIIEIK